MPRLPVLLPLAVALFFLPFAHASAESREPTRVLHLVGHGEVRAKPDQAVVTLGVVSEAPAAKEALEANNRAMTDLRTALGEAGIEDRDLQTANFSVDPVYDHSKEGAPPTVKGYRVTNQLAVRVRDLTKLGGVLDRAVSVGSNQIFGIGFSITDPAPLKDEARKLAVQDAARKAKLFAEAAGVKLGDIIGIAEGEGGRPPSPVYARAFAAEAKSVPISEGEQVVAVDVSMRWELE